MAQDEDITAPLEMDTLQAGWALKSSARPRYYTYLAFGAKTDLGQVRENNEDKFDFIEPEEPSVLATKGRIFAVADGMGGHSAGQVASELALNVFVRSYYSDASRDVEACLKKSVREANAYIVDVARSVPGRSGMGATLTAVVLRDDDLFIAQVGDSRCYLLRSGDLDQITEDHSWVAEQVRSGAMSLAEAEQSPFRNVITRSMGGAPEVEPDLTAIKLQVGDRFLLCSDGLSGMVPAEELKQMLAQGSPSVAAWNLVERANQYGGKDNITAMILHVLDVQPWPQEQEGEGTASEAGSNGHAGETRRESGAAAEPVASAPPSAAAQETRAGFMGRLFRRA
jgi:PPM family protein phosphatase